MDLQRKGGKCAKKKKTQGCLLASCATGIEEEGGRLKRDMCSNLIDE